jgi:hypothetical protein
MAQTIPTAVHRTQLPGHVWRELSPTARRVLAAIDAQAEPGQRAWWIGLRHIGRLADISAPLVIGVLSDLRAARVLDHLLVFDEAHTAAIVAPWPDRSQITAEALVRLARQEARPVRRAGAA